MFEINTQILIDATAEEVWTCLTDTKNYPIWNQFIRNIEGDFSEKQSLKINIVAPDDKVMNFTPICTIVKKNKELRWVGKMGFEWIFRGEHYFLLQEINERQIQLIHAEKFTGLLSRVFKKLRGDITRKGFEIMNHNLSEYVLLKNKEKAGDTRV